MTAMKTNSESAPIALVCGARPNFIKIAAIHRALTRKMPLPKPLIVHTGQHYSEEMSGVFFKELGMPQPDVQLDVGSGTHGEQTARALVGLERFLNMYRPALMICVGDVNSTLAAALAAAKCGVPSAHVEAGLRSRDRSMPEEINRIVADHICDWLYTTSVDADDNLRQEGIDPERIVMTGNVMIDTLESQTLAIATSDAPERLGLKRGGYILMTMHRPSTVDDSDNVNRLIEIIRNAAQRYHVVFPIHPRSRARLISVMNDERWYERIGGCGMTVCEPLGYVDFLALQRSAFCVLTDSGGVQEETTALGVPCLTLRPNTERPVTITHGTNHLVGLDIGRVMKVLDAIERSEEGIIKMPPLWDGHAAERIVDHIVKSVLPHQSHKPPAPVAMTVRPAAVTSELAEVPLS